MVYVTNTFNDGVVFARRTRTRCARHHNNLHKIHILFPNNSRNWQMHVSKTLCVFSRHSLNPKEQIHKIHSVLLLELPSVHCCPFSELHRQHLLRNQEATQPKGRQSSELVMLEISKTGSYCCSIQFLRSSAMSSSF